MGRGGQTKGGFYFINSKLLQFTFYFLKIPKFFIKTWNYYIMKDLCTLFEEGDTNCDFHNSAIDDIDDIALMGNALGFADQLNAEQEAFLASIETQDLIDIIDENLVQEERISIKERNRMKIPAFEQYVREVCGLR